MQGVEAVDRILSGEPERTFNGDMSSDLRSSRRLEGAGAFTSGRTTQPSASGSFSRISLGHEMGRWTSQDQYRGLLGPERRHHRRRWHRHSVDCARGVASNRNESSTLLDHGRGGRAQQSQSVPPGAPSNDPQAEFIAVVLADTEETWGRVFSAAGRQYREPVLVLFEDSVRLRVRLGISRERTVLIARAIRRCISISRSSASSIGDSERPVISPRPTSSRTRSGTTFKPVLGINRQVREAQQGRQSRRGERTLSVKLGLQADCLAGVWGHHASKKQLLDSGDVDEGLSAAAAIGDD